MNNRSGLTALFCLWMAISLALTGCRSQEAATPMAMETAQVATDAGGLAADRTTSNTAPASPIMPLREKAAEPTLQPQLIKEATVRMRVDRLPVAHRQIKQLVAGLGGYITMENTSLSEEGDNYRNAEMTIRLPQPNLERFLESAGGIGQVLQERVSATDVSKELVDTQGRIRNLKAEEAQLQQIMHRAGKITEVLEVERELARVQGEIEQAQGTLSYMKGQIAYSTVNLTLSEKMISPATNGQPGAGTVLINTIQQAWGALYGFVLGLIALGIWLLFFLPVILLLLAGFGWTLRRIAGVARKAWPYRRPSSQPVQPISSESE